MDHRLIGPDGASEPRPCETQFRVRRNQVGLNEPERLDCFDHADEWQLARGVPAVAGYTSGRLPLVSVIEAIQALWLVQAELIAADTELGLAWARLGRAIGSYEAMIQ